MAKAYKTILTKPIIKWTGTKKYCSELIVSNFPYRIQSYVEPFFGGGSVYAMVKQKRDPIKSVTLNDLCVPLMQFWNVIYHHPAKASANYRKQWMQLQAEGKDYYEQVRSLFNRTKDPLDFLFLTRTCYNGLIRFNSKGEFNSPFHHNRGGIHPDKFDVLPSEWHNILEGTILCCLDYRDLKIPKDAFVFMDPPYGNNTHMGFNEAEFIEWLKALPNNWALTYDRELNIKNTKTIPLPKSVSGFSKLKNNKSVCSREVLIINGIF